MKTKTLNVVMIATDNESILHFCPWDEPNKYVLMDNQKTNVGDTIAKHLYFMSDDEIKKGDWIIDCMITKNEIKQFDGQGTEGIPIKIEATTDTKLKIGGGTGKREDGVSIPLPQIPQSFIEAYIKAYNEGNPILTVDVEMENKQVLINKGFVFVDVIKTNSSNEVIIVDSLITITVPKYSLILSPLNSKENCINLFNDWINDTFKD